MKKMQVNDLSSNNLLQLLINLRTLCIENSELSNNDIKLIKNTINKIHNNKYAENNISPFPSKKFTVTKYLPLNVIEEFEHKHHYKINDDKFALCFINYETISYNNIENIINLDDIIINSNIKRLTNITKISNKIYSLNISSKLFDLDKLNLYLPPLNNSSRGGKRFIFKSQKLSKQLTEIIKKSNKLNKNFEFVNYVFRYNKFSPNDTKFKLHMDTPYFDKNNKHISKYTMILYLTSGNNENGVLNFDDIKITNICDSECIIFDQSLQHEGNPYVDGDKIFIRTELIYKYDDTDYEYDPEAAKIFNIGCYMAKQSVLNNDLNKYSSDCFNHAAQLRINNKTIFKTRFYFKYYFVTNGNDYWFHEDTSLDMCTYLMLKDYFELNDYKIDDITDEIDDIQDIYDYIKSLSIKCNDKIHYVEYSVSKKDQHCCPYHNCGRFDPTKCPDVIDMCNDKNKDLIDNYSVIVYDDKILIKENFDCDEQYIYVNGVTKSINFAACQTYGSYNRYINKSDVEAYCLPPIPYMISNGCVHLKFDVFNNDIVSKKTFHDIYDDNSDSDE